MRHAHWTIGLAFGLALSLLVLLAGPLLLFNPWFTTVLQARHGVAQDFGTSLDEVQRVTAAFLGDVFTDGEFTAGFDGQGPLLGAREQSHMGDVSRFVRRLVAVGIAAALAVAFTWFSLRSERRRIARLMVTAAAAIGAVAIALAIVFAIAFEPAFLAFHALFFPPGTYLFERGSDLIRLFPTGFWFDAALAAGASIVLTAVLVSLVGWRLWRSGR